MNDQSRFNTPEEDVTLLVQELRQLKEIMGDVSRRLGRIEERAKRAFPQAFPKQQAKGADAKTAASAPTMTKEQVLNLYDEIVRRMKIGETDHAKRILAELAVPDLNLMRVELGAHLGKKKPSKPALIEAIMKRVNESVMLTTHANRDKLIEQAEVLNQQSDRTENKES